jgi:hypothetical protein
MTSRSAHAGSIRTRSPGLAQPLPTWLERLGISAANEPAGPAVRVVLERGPAAPFRPVRSLAGRTTTVIAGSQLDVVA